jgi:hypothetical protein
MPAGRIVLRILRAAEIVAFVVAVTSFVCWLVVAPRHDPHHWQDQSLGAASPTLAVLTIFRRSWERYLDRRKTQRGIADN